MAFENPQTAAQFEFLNSWDRIVHIPGVWKGPVTKLSPEHAEMLVAQGRKDIQRKKKVKPVPETEN